MKIKTLTLNESGLYIFYALIPTYYLCSIILGRYSLQSMPIAMLGMLPLILATLNGRVRRIKRIPVNRHIIWLTLPLFIVSIIVQFPGSTIVHNAERILFRLLPYYSLLAPFLFMGYYPIRVIVRCIRIVWFILLGFSALNLIFFPWVSMEILTGGENSLLGFDLIMDSMNNMRTRHSGLLGPSILASILSIINLFEVRLIYAGKRAEQYVLSNRYLLLLSCLTTWVVYATQSRLLILIQTLVVLGYLLTLGKRLMLSLLLAVVLTATTVNPISQEFKLKYTKRFDTKEFTENVRLLKYRMFSDAMARFPMAILTGFSSNQQEVIFNESGGRLAIGDNSYFETIARSGLAGLALLIDIQLRLLLLLRKGKERMIYTLIIVLQSFLSQFYLWIPVNLILATTIGTLKRVNDSELKKA